MYELNNQEKALLKIILQNTRIDYIRKNKNILKEIELDENILYADDELENIIDNEIEIYILENIFYDKKISKAIKSLTYEDKLVIYFYYVKQETDKEISNRLMVSASAITKKRQRAINKIKRNYFKED